MEALLKRYRVIKRRIMNNEKFFLHLMWPYYLPIQFQPAPGLRFFCQNHGSCGSMYIVELLKLNGLSQCYHEKDPDLDVLGIAHYEGVASEERLKRVLIHSANSTVLERMCRYWANYNQRILDDLKEEDHLSLKFSDLIIGNINSLEEFIGSSLTTKKISPVNADKPVRKEGKYQPFESFSQADKETLFRICGPTMHALGYQF